MKLKRTSSGRTCSKAGYQFRDDGGVAKRGKSGLAQNRAALRRRNQEMQARARSGRGDFTSGVYAGAGFSGFVGVRGIVPRMAVVGVPVTSLGVMVSLRPSVWSGRVLMGIRAEARAHVERDAERLDEDDSFEEHASAGKRRIGLGYSSYQVLFVEPKSRDARPP